LTGEVVEGSEVEEDTEAVESESENGGFNFLAFFKFLKFSGFATAEEGSSKKLIYGGTIFLLLGILAVFIFVRKKRKAAHPDASKKFANDEDEIKDAEKKIREAQKEIDEVKGKRKPKEEPNTFSENISEDFEKL